MWKKYKSDKIYGVSARGVYELGKAHGYSYVYHMLFTDIFLVRDDLLPAKYRGMKLEDTFDSFPLHALSADFKKYEIMQIF
ncbi:MAG: hypothetical protein KBD43_16875 [Saprospiraceae bacterium]|nr:hypothetical protein [Saprospiraceae bacterium]